MTFKISGNGYAIPAREVVEVLPILKLRELPKSPDYVAGVLNYRGNLVPVIDVCKLIRGEQCENLASTRILIMNYPDFQSGSLNRQVGLRAERATETVNISSTQLTDPVVAVESAPYLGKQTLSNGEIIQLVDILNLLPERVQKILYPKKKNNDYRTDRNINNT